MYPQYQPNTFVESIVALIFYLIMAGFVLYSLLALYALMRYGRTKIITIAVALVYLIICGSLYLAAVVNLNDIKL